MTNTNPAGVLSTDSAAAKDVRDAELTLARIADAKALLATSPQVRVILLGVVVVLTVFGVWLRGLTPLGPAAAVIACAVLLASGLVLPSLSRRGRKEPRWVWAGEGAPAVPGYPDPGRDAGHLHPVRKERARPGGVLVCEPVHRR